MSAAIALFLANLPGLLKAGKTIGTYIHDFRQAAKQSGEWSEAAEAEYQQKLNASAKSSRWQTKG